MTREELEEQIMEILDRRIEDAEYQNCRGIANEIVELIDQDIIWLDD